MDVLTPERFFTLIVILGLLGVVWAVVWYTQKQTGRAGAGLSAPLSVTAVKALHDGGRMVLVHVAGQDVLVVTQRRGPAAVIRLTDASAPQVQP